MKTLFVWCPCGYVYRPQKSSICVYSKVDESLAKKGGGIVERLRHEWVLLPDKNYVVEESLSCRTMGRVSLVQESKKYLVKDVHKFDNLEVRLEYSTNCGFLFHHYSE